MKVIRKIENVLNHAQSSYNFAGLISLATRNLQSSVIDLLTV